MATQEDTDLRYARSEDIKAILAMKTIAIVGLSPDPFRASQVVALYMQRHGYRVIPVNPYCDFVLNEKVYPNLESIHFPVEVVDIFRRSRDAGAAVDDAIRKGAKAVWLQEGVIDEVAAERARRAGLLVVMDRCILKEHAFHAEQPDITRT